MLTHEISSALTSDESVDLLGIDACLMSSVEFAYQFRNDSTNSGFNAGIFVASAPNTWALGWDYRAILSRMNPSMTAKDFGMSILREERKSRWTMTQMSCLDLAKVSDVKEAVDRLAKELPSYKTAVTNIRGPLTSPKILYYFNASNSSERSNFPFFDLYALAEGIYKSPSFSTNTPVKNAAANLMNKVDDFIVDSFMDFAETGYSLFKPGKSGVHIFFGDSWSEHKKWYTYNPTHYIVTSGGISKDLGKLDWCDLSRSIVGYDWFTLMDFWDIP